MDKTALIFATILGIALFSSSSLAQYPLAVPWSTGKYGPDGPWQAVRNTVGGNDTKREISEQNHADIDVYPGGTYETFTITKSSCVVWPGSFCGKGGTWEPDVNATNWLPFGANHADLLYPWFGFWAIFVYYTSRALTINGKTVWNVSIMSSSSRGLIEYFNGTTSGIQLGFLGLGGPNRTQSFNYITNTSRPMNSSAKLFSSQ